MEDRPRDPTRKRVPRIGHIGEIDQFGGGLDMVGVYITMVSPGRGGHGPVQMGWAGSRVECGGWVGVWQVDALD